MTRTYLVRIFSLFLVQCAAFAHANDSDKKFIQPVPLQDVTLEANSRFDKAVSLNKEYLFGIDSDRLLKTFRFVTVHLGMHITCTCTIQCPCQLIQ